MTYTCIDAFSGAGGLALGLQRAGLEIIMSFDSDSRCIETQSLNSAYFRHSAVKAEIEEMLHGGLRKRTDISPGDLFLLAGGPPCQGFSVQRIGEDHDPRNELVGKFIQLVEETRPLYFLMENVPGIAGKRGKRILAAVQEQAETAGYWIHTRVLDAQDYRVPQRRRRVFVVGERKDGNPPTFQFPSRGEGASMTVREAIGHLPRPPANGRDHPNFAGHRRDKLSELNKQRLKALGPGEGRDQLPDRLIARCHRVSSSVIGHRDVYGRMEWDKVAPTITARFDSFTRGKFGHPDQIRSISLREGALLQTFPSDFSFSGSKVEVARQIGNAVPPILAEVLGNAILRAYKLRTHLE